MDSIAESLEQLGVSFEERYEFLIRTLLALRGYAGMVWQMETNAEWAPNPAPEGSLVEFLAARLVLDRLAIQHVAHESLGFDVTLADVRILATDDTVVPADDASDQRAFLVFQLAQIRGCKPGELLGLSPQQWTTLVDELESFGDLERRRVYHLAFERKYRNETLDAIAVHRVLMFFVIGSLESLLSAKAIDLLDPWKLDPWKRKTNMDRDIIAVGVGNLCSACVGGSPACGMASSYYCVSP